MNGREWLARQMDREELTYRQHQNCFTWIGDFGRAQQLVDEQLKTDWPALLESFGRQLNPLHEEIFAQFPTANYGTAYRVEWATDIIVFSKAGVPEEVDGSAGKACHSEFLLHRYPALFRQTRDEIGGSARPFEPN